MAGIQPDVPFSEPPAAGDNAEVVRLLVEAGANVRVANIDSDMILHNAAVMLKPHVVEYLLSLDAYTDHTMLGAVTATGLTPVGDVEDQLGVLRRDKEDGFDVDGEKASLKHVYTLIKDHISAQAWA